VLKENTAGFHPEITKDTKFGIKQRMLGPAHPLNKFLDDCIRPVEFQRLVGQLGIKLFNLCG